MRKFQIELSHSLLKYRHTLTHINTSIPWIFSSLFSFLQENIIICSSYTKNLFAQYPVTISKSLLQFASYESKSLKTLVDVCLWCLAAVEIVLFQQFSVTFAKQIFGIRRNKFVVTGEFAIKLLFLLLFQKYFISWHIHKKIVLFNIDCVQKNEINLSIMSLIIQQTHRGLNNRDLNAF